MADRAVGGFSTASLDYIPADSSLNTPAHARFHGSISTKLPANWRVERTGMLFASNRSYNKLTAHQDMPPSGTKIEGSGFSGACIGTSTRTHTLPYASNLMAVGTL